uniref:Bet v I/Major latex protein domain-containing protein n=1 Tax=Triticum urartu TaxID=4572 RepID=A0A8R7VEH5_TRIUA
MSSLRAAEVWEVYLGQLIPQLLPDVLSKVEVVAGDGGVGTVLRLTFPLGIPGLEYQKEKFIKIDNENFVKEALVIEGGLLDLGFLKYLVRLEIVGDADKTCIIRSTVEYEVEDEHTGNASFITASTFARIAEAITKYIKAH